MKIINVEHFTDEHDCDYCGLEYCEVFIVQSKDLNIEEKTFGTYALCCGNVDGNIYQVAEYIKNELSKKNIDIIFPVFELSETEKHEIEEINKKLENEEKEARLNNDYDKPYMYSLSEYEKELYEIKYYNQYKFLLKEGENEVQYMNSVLNQYGIMINMIRG